MKDYTTNKKEKGSFIINFTIIGDEIFIEYADEHMEIKDKTEEEIRRVLFILENQVRNSRKYENRIYTEIVTNLKKIIGTLVFTMLLVMIFINQGMLSASIIASLLGGIIALYDVIEVKDNRSVIKDIKKNRDFLESKSEILENIKTNPMVLTNTTEKTQKVVNDCLTREPLVQGETITLNDLDNISPRDMDLILANIEDINNTGQVSFESADKPYTIRPIKKNK